MKEVLEKNMSHLPWKNEEEFYDIHSRDIFYSHDFYESTIIGHTDEDFLFFILGELNLNPSSILIDLGCGSGYLAHAASRICKKAIGISTSKECITVCKERRKESEKLEFFQANMENYVNKGATHIVAMESMGYADMSKTFKSANKSLIHGGIFFIREVARLLVETPERYGNRKYIEDYFCYETRVSADIINCARDHGFEIMELKDHTESQNERFFIDSLKHNKAAFNLPYPDTDIFAKKIHIKFKKVKEV